MKPRLWRNDGVWFCTCLEGPAPDDIENYSKWFAATEGTTMEEAYENWLEESERIRGELENE